jgi:hypothetical protein
MTMWWPLANMLPMVLRIMMAKMEMTTLLVGRLVSGCSRALHAIPAISSCCASSDWVSFLRVERTMSMR